MAALVIVFAGIKLAAEIVVPFFYWHYLSPLFCSPVIKAMTQRKVPHGIAIALLFYFNFNRILFPGGIN